MLAHVYSPLCAFPVPLALCSANLTADSNAMLVILCELYADAETSLGNATGAAFYSSRAAAIRVGMNANLLSPQGDHYCTQSNINRDGSVDKCARDFVDCAS